MCCARSKHSKTSTALGAAGAFLLGRSPPRRRSGERAATLFDTAARPAAVDLREADQLALFGTLADLAAELPFPAQQSDRYRYFFENSAYSWADAITFARHAAAPAAEPDRRGRLRLLKRDDAGHHGRLAG